MSFINLVFYFLIIIPSAIIHEVAHGLMADHLGDPTARYAGRLTLDPRAHIDLWGTILMPLLLFMGTGGRFLFAYAKPVPYNPYNLKNQKWGPALVGLAGPAANFLLAFCFAMVVRFVPLPETLIQLLSTIIFANVGLMIFNLVPIPPLDGSKVLFALLPDSMSTIRITLERYGFMILLFFVFFMFELISPLIEGMFRLLVG
ncbi:MAG: site-2 protease family protein [Candidatus Magasanikbacteria bacterium]|nr:site-2 protease family protein [Candidatus Magasanikbacteria bacterium]